MVFNSWYWSYVRVTDNKYMYINFLHVLFYRDQIQPELRFMFVFLPGSLKKKQKKPHEM